MRRVNRQFRRVCSMLTLEGDLPADDEILAGKQWLCGVTDHPGPILFRGVKTYAVWAAFNVRPRPFGVYASVIRRLELYYTHSPDGAFWTEQHFVDIFRACTNLEVCINVGMAVRSAQDHPAVTLPTRLRTLRIKPSSMPVLFEWPLFEWGLAALTELTVGRWFGTSDDWLRLWRGLRLLRAVRIDDCPHFDTQACKQLYRHCDSLRSLAVLDHYSRVCPATLFGGASRLRKLERILFDRDAAGTFSAPVVEAQSVLAAISAAVGQQNPFPVLRVVGIRGYDISAGCMMELLWRSALLERVGIVCSQVTYQRFILLMALALPRVRVHHQIEPADI